METIRVAVLAAGTSRRFGVHKLLAPWRGRPLLLHALEQAQRACPGQVMLVTGHEAGAVEAAAGDQADTMVRNPDHKGGIGTSIAVAANACPAPTSALMIVLGDQPLVTDAHLRALIAAWDREPGSIVATAWQESFGPPVLFGRRHLPALGQLGDDRGARHILQAHPECVTRVEFQPAAIDIDTPDDFEGLYQADSSEQTNA